MLVLYCRYEVYITEVLEQMYDMAEDDRYGEEDRAIVCYQTPVMIMLVTACDLHSSVTEVL